MFFSTMLICLGSIITSTAWTFEHFITGRIITGAGGGGIFIVASIMAIQMTSPQRRGLYMGLANTAMTVGVSLGAVIAGALEPRIGWVRIAHSPASLECSSNIFSETSVCHSNSCQLSGSIRLILLHSYSSYFKKCQIHRTVAE